MFIRFSGIAQTVLLSIVLLSAVGVDPQDSNDQLLHHWDYDRNAPLDIKQAGIQQRESMSIYDISFSSPVGERSAAVGAEWRHGARPTPRSATRARAIPRR